MPMLLADAASKVDLWTISAPTAANAMQVAYVKYDGKLGGFQLTSKALSGSLPRVCCGRRFAFRAFGAAQVLA